MSSLSKSCAGGLCSVGAPTASELAALESAALKLEATGKADETSVCSASKIGARRSTVCSKSVIGRSFNTGRSNDAGANALEGGGRFGTDGAAVVINGVGLGGMADFGVAAGEAGLAGTGDLAGAGGAGAARSGGATLDSTAPGSTAPGVKPRMSITIVRSWRGFTPRFTIVVSGSTAGAGGMGRAGSAGLSLCGSGPTPACVGLLPSASGPTPAWVEPAARAFGFGSNRGASALGSHACSSTELGASR